jgi:hypothetical protein
MEPIEVIARFTLRGEIEPIRFRWHGDDYPVESTGRSWTDDQGYHVLVMIPGGQVHELLFVPNPVGWYLILPRTPRRAA